MGLLPFTRYILFHSPFTKKSSTLHKNVIGHVRFVQQKNSTFNSNHCERLSWERSTQDILLGKLRFCLRNHQVNEAYECFHDCCQLVGID
ncbi:hypothetical protein Lalb_Chr05g0220871 [Lupinus albus]|uniref:Uncharacterized protein n=1 Tax=Lupinus albus TaxID=3870 RepID=A0A6A4QKS2_LUPAL|nr:hypothetical protein Lalb_Chr05g0220871 [Lupinus albus]